MTRLKTGILVYPDVEVLDFCGPFEVFLVAETTDLVKAAGGMRVVPDHSFDTCPPLDILLAPGGWGTREQVHNPRLIEWVKSQSTGAKFVTSVCTGSFLLGQAGLLAGRRATTHWMSLDRMRTTFPDVVVEDALHWVEDGNIFTSAGIAAGIDLALAVVAKVCGEQIARATAKYMEYPFPESNSRRI